MLIAVLLVATRTRLEPTEPVERVWNVETLIVARHDHQPHMKVFGELAAGRSSEMRALGRVRSPQLVTISAMARRSPRATC